ncbi:hypothetical protein AB0G02_06415 [Actinosynnema sp. NPDC023658]|uniref:hypothetical protein n=1 Tax=Actinosynnema sp. NPDC023658 TaxID=3155465 RepID=UPI0033D84EAC
MENDRGHLRGEPRRGEEVDPVTGEVIGVVVENDEPTDVPIDPGDESYEGLSPQPAGGGYRYLDSEPGEPPPVRGDTR